MPIDRRRRSDSDEDRSYKNRKFVDLRSVLIIVAALSGGSLTNLGIDFAKENETNVAVERTIEVESSVRELRSSMEDYIKHHESEVAMKDKMLDEKLDDVKAELRIIRDNVEKIEDLIRNSP